MATTKSLLLLIIGLTISLAITLYFQLNIVWSGINGFATMTLVLWIDKKIRGWRQKRDWNKHFRDNA